MDYPFSWPRPVGASGGGFFVWNEWSNRAELVGLFTACARAQTKAILYGPALHSLPVGSFGVPLPEAPGGGARRSADE